MSDTTDDMEYDLSRTFCKDCHKHIEECKCEYMCVGADFKRIGNWKNEN